MIKILILFTILLILLFLVISRINNLTIVSRMPKLLMPFLIVFLTLTLFLSLRFLNNTESKGTYVPAKYDGKDLIPGKVEIEK